VDAAGRSDQETLAIDQEESTMSSNVNPGRFLIACLCALLAAAPASSQEPMRRAVLHISLPADAQLSVNGAKTKQTGMLRHFYSPPLEAEKSYHYTFAWTYERDGQTIERKETIHVRAGDDKAVDLTREATQPEAQPQRKGDKKTDKKAARKLDVVYLPTPPEVVDKMLELANVKKDDVVYDLGCGDGRIVIAAAKKYQCKAVGFDLDDDRVREARANVKAAGVEALVTIEKKNLFDVDVKPASVVALYLLPELNVKLLPQLKKLKDGSRIVSHDFEIEGYPPKQTATVPVKEEGSEHRVYLWQTPLREKK
jgi:uncharacterized protein (TIGR03000 family)